MDMTPAHTPLLSAGDPAAILDAVLGSDRRALLTGPPGIGKSTLVHALAARLGQAGRRCWCLGADPGSPHFGVPGAVCLGRWDGARWVLESVAALCTLDAGRFRLPLVSAVAALGRQALPGVVLVDGPGVVRGVAGAELLSALVQAARIEVVLALFRDANRVPLREELATLALETVTVQAAHAAQRPGKRARARHRTALWDAYLGAAREQRLDLARLRVIGTPPPPAAPVAWIGRQLALLDGERTVAMGEVTALEAGVLRARLPAAPDMSATLLVRDAGRSTAGFLETSTPFAAERLDYLPPPAAAPHAAEGSDGGPRVVGRVGMLDVALVNGVFGDPLLHARLRHARRSLLFDLGEGSRLPARIAHQVSDVFITHCHFDHIAGFLWLLRSRIGAFPACRLYGPPGLAARIDGFTQAVLWDRIEDRGPRFEVLELHGERLQQYGVQAGKPGCEPLGEQVARDGVLLAEPGFRVRAAILEHGTPVLAFAFEPAPQVNMRKDRLRARGLRPGPWLAQLKRHVLAGEEEAPLELPDGRRESTRALAADLVLITPGKRLVYATDFSDIEANRQRLIDLARGAHTLFCEATFLECDAQRAQRNAHLTTRACGEIAAAAGVARLVPFHFSRRYERDPLRPYEEIAAVCPRTAIPKSMAVLGGGGRG